MVRLLRCQISVGELWWDRPEGLHVFTVPVTGGRSEVGTTLSVGPQSWHWVITDLVGAFKPSLDIGCSLVLGPLVSV